ncbi:unnamed protein product, partial [Urochloa humidicola]
LSSPPSPLLLTAAPPTAPPATAATSPAPAGSRSGLGRGSEWERRRLQTGLVVSLALVAPLRVTQLIVARTVADPDQLIVAGTVFAADPEPRVEINPLRPPRMPLPRDRLAVHAELPPTEARVSRVPDPNFLIARPWRPGIPWGSAPMPR